jgi:hypothetical protein
LAECRRINDKHALPIDIRYLSASIDSFHGWPPIERISSRRFLQMNSNPWNWLPAVGMKISGSIYGPCSLTKKSCKCAKACNYRRNFWNFFCKIWSETTIFSSYILGLSFDS